MKKLVGDKIQLNIIDLNNKDVYKHSILDEKVVKEG